jgi:ATP-dependent DNA helicase DinG
MAKSVQAFFSNSGPLALAFERYHLRASQLQMSLMVEKIFSTKGFNCIEAETGIGKSFAYLVPSIFKAIKDKQKIVISTHTIALQEQLFYKDIPFLLDLLHLELNVVLVKGMNNYLCLEKLERLKSDPVYFKNPHLIQLSSQLEHHEKETDQRLLSTLPKELHQKLCCDSLSCMAHTCDHFKNCHFFNARKPIEDASILIVNHHLLLTDLSLKNEGTQEAVLPSAHHLIIDEAHHIPSIAEELFSHELSEHSLEPRLKPKYLKDHLEKIAKGFKKHHEESLLFFCETEAHDLIEQILLAFRGAFETAFSYLEPTSNYLLIETLDPDLCDFFDNALFKLKDLESSLDHLLKTAKELELHEHYRSSLFILDKLKNEAISLKKILTAFKEIKKDKLFFYEKTAYHAFFKCHYLDASKSVGTLFESTYLSTTFCSATLTFDNHFESFKHACGLKHDKIFEGKFSSDFDYKKAMLFGIPSDMPEPHHHDYELKLYQFCYETIKATQGGVFILFTSYDQLHKMADKLKTSDLLHTINLLIQGTDSKQNLLTSFKGDDHSVLLGTDSFWEGVDVQGDKLRAVIITKLPFRSPADPIFQATAVKLKEEKKDPFFSLSLPEACIKFKQGIGRLIRSQDDYGVVICTDMRLINKQYGKYFLHALPNCQKKLAPAAELIEAIKLKLNQQSLKIGV